MHLVCCCCASGINLKLQPSGGGGGMTESWTCVGKMQELPNSQSQQQLLGSQTSKHQPTLLTTVKVQQGIAIGLKDSGSAASPGMIEDESTDFGFDSSTGGLGLGDPCSRDCMDYDANEEAAREATLCEVARRLKLIGDQVDDELRASPATKSILFGLASGSSCSRLSWTFLRDLLKLCLSKRPVEDCPLVIPCTVKHRLLNCVTALPWCGMTWQMWAPPGAFMASYITTPAAVTSHRPARSSG